MVLFFCMKNLLMIPLVFLAHVCLWVCVLSLFSALGSSVILDSLVEGNFRLFFVTVAYRGVIYFPFCCLLSLIMVFFFVMRHSAPFFLAIPLVLLLSSVLVVFAIPFSYSLLGIMERHYPDAIDENITLKTRLLAPGYIRHDGAQGILWIDMTQDDRRERNLMIVDERQVANSLTAHPSAVFNRQKGVLEDESGALVTHAAGTDPLFSPYRTPPRYIEPIISRISTVTESFRALWLSSPLGYWVSIGCFFLAVCALWAMCYSTGWRMLNAFIVIAAFGGLFFAYPYTVSGVARDLVARVIPTGTVSGFVSPLIYAVFTALVMLISIGAFIIRKISRARAGA
jgi:hypothetical protein